MKSFVNFSDFGEENSTIPNSNLPLFAFLLHKEELAIPQNPQYACVSGLE